MLTQAYRVDDFMPKISFVSSKVNNGFNFFPPIVFMLSPTFNSVIKQPVHSPVLNITMVHEIKF